VTLPAALGTLYVTEGATLGGQLISRQLERHLGLCDGRGYAFFQSYGSGIGVMWRRFLAELRRHDTPEMRPAIIAGAIDTFATFEHWLTTAPAHDFGDAT